MKKHWMMLVACCLFGFSNMTFALAEEAQANTVQPDENKEEVLSLEQKYEALLLIKAQLQEENQQLSLTIEKNEQILSTKQKEHDLVFAPFQEVFAVAKTAAKILDENYQASYLTKAQLQTSPSWQSLLEVATVPTLPHLSSLWQAMQEKIMLSRRLTVLDVPYVQGNGVLMTTPVMQMGDMGLIAEQGYVSWDFNRQQAMSYAHLPKHSPKLSTINNTAVIAPILMDPMRGTQLNNFSEQPTLWQRILLAGIVGKIILLLLFVGMIIATYRSFDLLKIKQQVKKQLRQPETIKNNPLGRILAVFDQEKVQSVETLELRLLETILDEQQGLERGLSMLKLLAALAPMLGLLGTVTGMIETFQVITQFGNGDPKIMAGGISMALMTTVLGLIAAMPLLLAHNMLSTLSEDIHNILEKQGVSLVARRAEQEMKG